MNVCFFTGRLTRDPEVKNLASGSKVADIGLAVNEGKNKDGSDRVQFFNLVAWNGQADFAVEYLKKGKPINVQCRAQTDKWEDKTSGEARTAIKFVVDRFNFVPGDSEAKGGIMPRPTPVVSEDSDVAEMPKKRGRKPKVEVQEVPETDNDENDEEVPF
jgi:single-strand DNA-binding protein